ncbi:MAG: hypothetical protein U0031_16680 [Thermomicrobiales bacterium]
MNLPPLRNPFTRMRSWARENRAQAEVALITGIALGTLILMMVVTIVAIVWKLR